MTDSTHVVYLGLGSNVGDRAAKLLEAEHLLALHPHLQLLKKSTVYETEPWPKHEISGGRGVEKAEQHWHLNQVLQLRTELPPLELLRATQAIERKMGKVSKSEWGSREIDIDILLYIDEILDLPTLKIPHPHMKDREFVLVPLLEITPTLIDPISASSFRHFLDQIQTRHVVRPYLKPSPDE